MTAASTNRTTRSTSKTRWARRLAGDFPTTVRDAFTKKHLAQIEDATPGFAKKLEAARRSWEKQFWAAVPIKKADAEEDGLTTAEIAALRQAAKNLNGGEFSEAIYDEMAILVQAGWDDARHLLDLTTGFNVMPAWVLKQIREQADEFAVLVNDREQSVLLDTIELGVASGQTPRALADSIKQAFAEGFHAGDNLVLPTDEWAEMVARTELSRAQTFGQIALYKEAQIEKVLWATTEGGNVCPECEERDGEIYTLDEYEADPAPLHPRCCCTAIPADEDVNPDALDEGDQEAD